MLIDVIDELNVIGGFCFLFGGVGGDAICIADSYRIIDNYKSPELGLNLSGS